VHITGLQACKSQLINPASGMRARSWTQTQSNENPVMPPPDSSHCFHIIQHTAPFYLFKLAPTVPIPEPITSALLSPTDPNAFVSVTRTHEEISIVTTLALHDDFDVKSALVKPEDGQDPVTQWAALTIKGPMDLSLTGIMCDLTTPLKREKVPVFALSTWNTDYLLIPQKGDYVARAVRALQLDGWVFA